MDADFWVNILISTRNSTLLFLPSLALLAWCESVLVSIPELMRAKRSAGAMYSPLLRSVGPFY